MEKETGTVSGASTFFAFMLGAATGAGLALLMAPKAGHEVRGKIKELSSDAMSKSKEYAEMMQEKAKSAVAKGRSAVEGKETVKEKAHETVGAVSGEGKGKMEETGANLS